jgi:hypothetical protein
LSFLQYYGNFTKKYSTDLELFLASTASVGMTPLMVPASFAVLATPAVTAVIAATADSGAPACVSLVLVRHFALTPRVVRLMHYGITAAIVAVAVLAMTA